MKLQLSKFGDILVSRPAGREAMLVLNAYQLSSLPPDETLELDFAGIKVLSPSWADEVVTPIARRFSSLRLVNTANASVQATLETLRKYSDLPPGLVF